MLGALVIFEGPVACWSDFNVRVAFDRANSGVCPAMRAIHTLRLVCCHQPWKALIKVGPYAQAGIRKWLTTAPDGGFCFAPSIRVDFEYAKCSEDVFPIYHN